MFGHQVGQPFGINKPLGGSDMQTHTIYAAKKHLSQLVDAAAGGETIIISKSGKPVAKLVPITARARRGMLPGVTFNIDASDGLDAEIMDLFEGKA